MQICALNPNKGAGPDKKTNEVSGTLTQLPN